MNFRIKKMNFLKKMNFSIYILIKKLFKKTILNIIVKNFFSQPSLAQLVEHLTVEVYGNQNVTSAYVYTSNLSDVRMIDMRVPTKFVIL